MIPAIFGLAGESLSDAERGFFREADPAGFILFARNCRDRIQLRRLTDSLRHLAGRGDVPILVDQEGGRVARLRPPEWPAFPAPGRFGDLYRRAPISAIEAMRANAEAIGLVLGESGINVNCAPVLDLRVEGADEVIGDRSLGREPMQVAALGRAMLDGLAAAGVCGVLKHMPGHGRARADSHTGLPVVETSDEELAEDIAPFRALREAPIAMTAHILFTAWDRSRPATISPTVVGETIRGRIGFEGLLISDDLAMDALSGPLAERAEAALAAGCDLVLHGTGRIEESATLAAALGPISPAAAARLDRALASVSEAKPSSTIETLEAKRDALLGCL